MSETECLVQQLEAAQNEDGGWPYRKKGISWTEPTAFAIIALQYLANSPTPAIKRGLAWLLSQKRPTGGWGPNPEVQECTSVTSIATLAVLLSKPRVEQARLDHALAWTVGQVYTDELSFPLLLSKITHVPPSRAPGSVPWYPGTAGWVIPTALTSIALTRAGHQLNRPHLVAMGAECCMYLLGRRCIDHGWNHGGSKVRSENARSYPETTGIALLALRAAAVEQPARSLALAKEFSNQPHSMEGLSFIQMAIGSPVNPVPDPPQLPKIRTTLDIALRLTALSAQRGSNPFLPNT